MSRTGYSFTHARLDSQKISLETAVNVIYYAVKCCGARRKSIFAAMDQAGFWSIEKCHNSNATSESITQEQRHQGDASWFRLTERWTAGAKSVFRFDVQGAVAKSTHAGLPWLLYLRENCEERVHFWPFDGWSVPEGKSAVVEVYPSLLDEAIF
jgi:hypothetical protein